MVTIETPGGTRTWRGDPTDTGKIEAWKSSYQTGYQSQIISPRDSGGNYTSNPKEIETYSMISKEQQAKEIASTLKSETAVPAGIVQSLAKILGVVVDRITHKNPPIGITDTKRITGDNTAGGNELMYKIPSVLILAVLAIIAFVHIRKS